jgi:hypothetical protein
MCVAWLNVFLRVLHLVLLLVPQLGHEAAVGVVLLEVVQPLGLLEGADDWCASDDVCRGLHSLNGLRHHLRRHHHTLGLNNPGHYSDAILLAKHLALQ